MRFFLAGIIQGSKAKGIHGQDYRERLRQILRSAFPEDEVYCPMEEHPESISYGRDNARKTFFGLMSAASQADVLVAYLPQASMGTAIEMWEAKRAGRCVIAISPMKKNWVIRFLTDVVYETLEDFELAVADGSLTDIVFCANGTIEKQQARGRNASNPKRGSEK